MNREARIVPTDRLAGTLISAGAAVALIAMVLSGFFLVFVIVMGVLSFGLVFTFGCYVARRRPEGSVLAAATLWLATFGGTPFLWLVGLSGWGSSPSIPAMHLGAAGTMLAIAGAVVKLVVEQDRSQAPDPRSLERAAGLLGVGSLALLLAGAGTYPRPSVSSDPRLIWTAVFVVVGLWFHLGAWIALFIATKVDFHEGPPAQRLNRGRLAWSVSVLSFVAAIFSWPLYGLSPGQGLLAGPFLFFLGPLSPFNPAVFAPVVFAHAYIFLAYSRFLPEQSARRTVGLGALLLAAAATVGLVGLLVSRDPRGIPGATYWWLVAPFPSGSTVFGYWLVLRGWRRGTRGGHRGSATGPGIGQVAR